MIHTDPGNNLILDCYTYRDETAGMLRSWVDQKPRRSRLFVTMTPAVIARYKPEIHELVADEMTREAEEAQQGGGHACLCVER